MDIFGEEKMKTHVLKAISAVKCVCVRIEFTMSDRKLK